MKSRYFVFSLILSIFTMFSFLSVSYAQNLPADTEQASHLGFRIVGTAGLNVRSQPLVGDNVLGAFKHGDRIMVIKKDSTGFWCQVEYKNVQDAWVYCPYLMMESTGTAPQPSTGQTHGAALNEKATVNVSALNVRSAPAMGQNVLGHVIRGDIVTIKEKDASTFWCKIDFQNKNDAWVACKFLKREQTGTAPQPSTGQTHGAALNEKATVNVSALNVRSAPAMGQNVLGHLIRGDIVTIKEKDASTFWCKIDFQNRNDAWVACKFLQRS